MSIPYNLVDPQRWAAIKREIEDHREERMAGLLQTTPENLRGDQQYIAALDWVLERGDPMPEKSEEPIYDD